MRPVRWCSSFVVAAIACAGVGAVACGGGGDDQATIDFGTGQPPPAPASDAGTAAPSTAPEDAAAPADAGSSMATWTPSAKGLWIWYFDYVGMTAAQAAQKAKDLGVGYVLIKSGQDGSFWSTRFTPQAVAEFTSRGIRVLAWPYMTPSGGQAAIDAAVQAAKTPGCDGLVLDVEIEFEGAHAQAAQTLCEGIRKGAPGVWLGYTSFGWVGYHTTFPFQAFDTYCGDAFWPQVYFSDRGVAWDGSQGLSQAISMYKAAGLKAPFWPIASNDDVYNTSVGPTTSDLNGFFQSAGARASLWEFPPAGASGKLSQLAQLMWKND